MRVSQASTYALQGLVFLASGGTRAFVPVSEICQDGVLPEKHLAKIFQSLVRVGLLKSARGSTGGFALARPPEHISALDVVDAVDGPLPIDECPVHRSTCDGPCPVGDTLGEARENARQVLRRTTIAGMAERLRP